MTLKKDNSKVIESNSLDNGIGQLDQENKAKKENYKSSENFNISS